METLLGLAGVVVGCVSARARQVVALHRAFEHIHLHHQKEANTRTPPAENRNRFVTSESPETTQAAAAVRSRKTDTSQTIRSLVFLSFEHDFIRALVAAGFKQNSSMAGNINTFSQKIRSK